MTYTAARGRSVAFVDSSAWIALLVPTDQHHRAARSFFRSTATRLRFVTSNYVVAETVTWLIYHQRPNTAREFRRMLEASQKINQLSIAWVSVDLHAQAWDLLEQYNGQPFSFCDCSSFVLSKDRNVEFMFGFDSDFRILGLELRPA